MEPRRRSTSLPRSSTSSFVKLGSPRTDMACRAAPGSIAFARNRWTTATLYWTAARNSNGKNGFIDSCLIRSHATTMDLHRQVRRVPVISRVTIRSRCRSLAYTFAEYAVILRSRPKPARACRRILAERFESKKESYGCCPFQGASKHERKKDAAGVSL